MLVFDVVDPQELAGFVRELDPRLYGFDLDRFLPNQYREDVEYAFNRSDRQRANVASYRAFDAESSVAKRPGFERVRGQIPPLSIKILLGEEQRLRLQQLRGFDGQIADQIFDDAAQLVEAVHARFEQARGDALFTAKVQFDSDEGFDGSVEIDYTVGGTIPVTALTAPSNLWSDHTNGTPIKDMQTMVRDYMSANKGKRPVVTLTSQEVIDHALQCVEVKNFLQHNGIVPSIVTLDELNRIGGSLNLPPLAAYDTEVMVADVSTRVTPRAKLAMLPAPSTATFGETTFGITAESLELVQSNYLTIPTAPGLVGVVMKSFDPVNLWTKVAGLAIPVVKDPRAIGTATVIA